MHEIFYNFQFKKYSCNSTHSYNRKIWVDTPYIIFAWLCQLHWTVSWQPWPRGGLSPIIFGIFFLYTNKWFNWHLDNSRTGKSILKNLNNSWNLHQITTMIFHDSSVNYRIIQDSIALCVNLIRRFLHSFQISKRSLVKGRSSHPKI